MTVFGAFCSNTSWSRHRGAVTVEQTSWSRHRGSYCFNAEFGLIVSFAKIMALMRWDLLESDSALLSMATSVIKSQGVRISLPGMGSPLGNSSHCSTDVRSCQAAAMCAFGELPRAVFRKTSLLTIKTKHLVFFAHVMSTLLCEAGCWVPLQEDVHRLSSFYLSQWHVWSILGLSMKDVSMDRVTTVEILHL